ncbi:bifunctional adenosylcobinamide kinase/adenosylcobinamide-phosphate guanylyltransferase [Pseudoalteromonas citrea]|uniref:Bifunctional adenosylcobalamin biosynthesis protein n=1 Tax=Pseudoalteromonas citrea TaxID=43655 RepID=A0A5S3XT79_9GAMM|nr:bifunctional adenosylcobinamide kinase/adenosylcobinamide-phosphate guanylyltransferase [Pseudoalteromonas citrea]TMP45061.1 bifunctional adenosylcobinamide kinase/adenosylcobinamide-phosphate guanylyltransferase [Pseudoalteromonas citrea]TMP61557.1 bifunctional adenosylcobinamide kinase/adenosylcobinamide-phosphate guanylyltransferase [Pseudoalteromonas citrea]
MTERITLMLGGARSGKSRLAEQLAEHYLHNRLVKKLLYVATAEVKDNEMAERVKHHQAARSAHWTVVEEAWALPEVIADTDEQTCILVDCLTLWLTHGLCEQGIDAYIKQKSALLRALGDTQAKVILVSNEVGHGIVPLGELSRTFVEQSGWLHQDIAQLADRVDFIMAGCTLRIK